MPTADEYLKGLIADQVLGQERTAATNTALLQDPVGNPPPTQRDLPPMQSSYTAGLRQGANALVSDIEYFKGLGNTLVGRDEAAQLNFDTARARSDQASNAVQGFESFEEFLDEPTFGGFIDQIGMGLGQVTPFAAETIGAALVTGLSGGAAAPVLAGVVGKKALSEGTEQITKRLVTDIIKKKARGQQLDAMEEDVAESLYGQFKKGFRRGVYAGTVGGTYPINTGESFKEFDEAGVELTPDRAVQSLALGAASTAVELGGEALVFRKLARLAQSRARTSDPTNIFNIYAKNIRSGAVTSSLTEGATELVQEGLLVGQRLAVDEQYTIDDAQLRLGQAWFLGTVAGTAMGGGGGAIATTPEAVSRVFNKAQELTRRGRQQGLDSDLQEGEYGDVNSIFTTPEPQGDIFAQYDAMQDPSYGKQAVWVAGEPADNNLAGVDEKPVGVVERNGKQVHYAYIKGRGTIFSEDSTIVEDVLNNNASDESIGRALGFSSTKSAMDAATEVVQVRDENGAIISEELTTPEGQAAAIAAAQQIAGEKGRVTLTSLDKAQKERARRYSSEQSRRMVIDPDEPADPNEQTNTDATEQNAASLNLTEVEPEAIDLGEEAAKPYAPRATWDTVFEQTEQLRKEYNSTFDTEINWETSPLGLASDAALKKAIELQGRNPQTAVSLVQGSDGQFTIEANQLDGSLYTIQDSNGNQRRLPLGQFIVESIKRATKRSKFNRPRKGVPFVTVTKEGNSQGVNIADLVSMGKRINQTELGGSFEGIDADVSGFSTVLGALAEQGYTVEVDGARLQGDNRAQIPETYKQVSIDKQGRTLYDLLSRQAPSRATQLTPAQQTRLATLEQQIDSFIARELDTFVRDNNPTRQEFQARSEALQRAKTKRLRDEEISFGFAREEMVDTASSASTPLANVPSLPSTEIAVGVDGNTVFTLDEGGGRPAQVATTGVRADGTGVDTRLVPNNAPAPEGEIDVAQIARQEGVQATRTNVEMGENNPGTSTRPPRQQVDPEAVRQSAEEWLSNNKQAEVYGSIPETASALLNQMLKQLRLKGKVVVITAKDLRAGLRDGTVQLGNVRLDAPSIVDALSNGLSEVTSSDGVYISLPQMKGADAHVIILNDARLTNEAELSLALAHEVGHAFFKEELAQAIDNPELRARLYRDFRKALEANPDLYSQYDEDVQFEEWAADQTAKWGASELKAKGIVDRFFKALAARLRSMWDTMRRGYRQRFGQEYSQSFDEFVKDVIRAKDDANVSSVPDTTAPSALQNARIGIGPVRQMKVNSVRNAVELAVGEKINATQEAGLAENVAKAWEGLLKLVLPTQTRLRRLGAKVGAGVKIANMMYGRSGEKGLGFVQRTTLKINDFENRLEDLFYGNLDYMESQQFLDAAKEAASSRPTAELSEEAQKIRRFLDEIYDDYIAKEPNTRIGKQENYFPVLLDLELVQQNLDRFAEVIATQRGDITASQVKERMTEVINNANAKLDNPKQALEEGIDPLHTAEEAIELTRGIDRELLAEFSKPPEVALVQYMRRIVKRVEWNRATKGGDTTLSAELAKLNPKEFAEAQKALGALLGFYVPLSKEFQALSSVGQNIQIWTTLSLATLSSIPELATAIIATREFGGVMTGFREIVNTITDARERYEFARDLGVVSNESMANAFMAESDLQYMDETNRKFANAFFKYTGLDAFTRFTRVFASGMGAKFIESHALRPRERSARYLDELGLDADIVKAWISEGRSFDTPAGEAVKAGLQKFVESTMLRPNAAERPVWASDPRYALLWQLKSFPYSYGQVVIGGVLREMKARQQEGRAAGKTGGQIVVEDLAPHLALFGLAVLPFAMLSLELKEGTKYAMGAILPFAEADSRVFRTDNMDWGEYFAAAYGSAGVFGPLSLLTSAQTDVRWGKPPVSLFGPTVDTLWQVLIKGDYERMLPLYNQFG